MNIDLSTEGTGSLPTLFYEGWIPVLESSTNLADDIMMFEGKIDRLIMTYQEDWYDMNLHFYRQISL